MLFNSYIFLFLFLPLALAGWYGLNYIKRYNLALVFLCGMSFWFYAYFNPRYLLLLAASIAMNYGISFAIRCAECRAASERTEISAESASSRAVKTGAAASSVPDPGQVPLSRGVHRFFLILGVSANLCVFFYFKYYDFFITNVNAVFGTDYALRHIVLPLGISFFTFQQLSFIIDRATGRAPHYPLLNYVTFVTFFPQLIAGPIVLYDEMMPQFMDPSKRRPDKERFRQGIYIFVLGLAKKCLLADSLSGIVAFGFEKVYYLEFWTAAFVMLSYTFQLYFDFSGYCDMAVGLGKMFGIDLPVNFDSPYKSCNFREIWRRWHITLGRFFTRYVYIPLGGNRRGTARTILNVLIVFALSGLWHGAAWTFVVWGIFQGVLTVFDNLGILVPAEEKKRHYLLKGAPFLTLPRPVMCALTFILWTLSLIFFRSDSMAAAAQMFRNLRHFWWPGYVLIAAEQFAPTELYPVRKALELTAPGLVRPYSLVLWLTVLAVDFYIVFFRKNSMQMMKKSSYSRRTAVLLAVLFVWSVTSLSGVSEFLYFNF
ncbi:MAG: MBOAT family O-acyltransferase [Lachnospiraceae bacterium]|nr:MBOAT family O-acyltransferase [Lachnospiraceae bacterium]